MLSPIADSSVDTCETIILDKRSSRSNALPPQQSTLTEIMAARKEYRGLFAQVLVTSSRSLCEPPGRCRQSLPHRKRGVVGFDAMLGLHGVILSRQHFPQQVSFRATIGTLWGSSR